MVYSPKLSFVANGSNLTGVGLALGKTICFYSLEFTIDHLGRLSLSPEEGDSGALFVGILHSGSPSLHTALEDSFDEGGAASGEEGSSGSPDPRAYDVATPRAPITTTLAPESTPVLLTIPTVMVQTAAPQPDMELLPNQQQAYQEEEEQAWIHARQVDAELPAAQCHDELTSEQAAIDA
jgi:hypothetical protein